MARAHGFVHEALFYSSEAEFFEGTTNFLKDGVAEGAPTLVAVDPGKITGLRSMLGADADAVEFADMAAVGRNPARIIPTWREFVDRHRGTGSPLRGIGEPVWPGRTADELVECRHHESLLNLAFADDPAFWLLCPYDTAALDPVVIREAHATHPFVCSAGGRTTSPAYDGGRHHQLFDERLPEPPPSAATFPFTEVAAVRRWVMRHALAAGLAPSVASDVVLAVDEVAANSLRHGGGHGTVTTWRGNDTLICQVDDVGHIVDPLVGRRQPDPGGDGSRGLWITNQLCQLLQVRNSPQGTTVRLHFTCP